MKEAIRQRDAASLSRLFLPGAKGMIPTGVSERVSGQSWWHQFEDEGERKQATGREVAQFLVDAVSHLTAIDKVGLRVLQIQPVAKTDDQYRMLILLSVAGTDDRGPASMESKHFMTAQFDHDGQIETGRIVRRWDVESTRERGATQSLFTEVTESYGLDQLNLPDNWMCEPGTQPDTYTSQIAVDDFDRDGFLDIAVSTLQGNQYLLRSRDGLSFEDVTAKVGLPSKRLFSYSTLATWIDYDNDRYPDLLIGRTLYRNEKGERFRRVATSGLRFEAATMGAVVADFDCDGWLDLYVLNHLGDRGNARIGFVDDDTVSGVKNQLWRNLGNGTFADVTEQAGVDGDRRHSFSAAWFHANEDRFPDLYLVNDFGRNCLFINTGDGRFKDVTEQLGVGDFANSMGVAAGDLDNDGNSEIYVANMFSKMGRRIIANVSPSDYPEGVFRGIEGACAGSHLYQWMDEAQRYQEISVEKRVNEIGWAYAPVMADFDSDGLLDIYATSGFISVDRNKPDG